MKPQTIALTSALFAATACEPLESRVDPKVPAFSVKASTAYKDKYLLRIGKVPINKTVVQSSLDISSPRYAPGFTLGAWENYTPSSNDHSEVDVLGDYTHKFSDHFEATVGLANYTFRFGEEIGIRDIQQGKVEFETKNMPIDMKLGTYQLFSSETDNGREYIFGLGKKFGLTDRLSAKANADIHFNERFNSPTSDFSITTGSIEFKYDLGKGFGLQAGFKQQFALDRDNFSDEHQWSFGGSVKF